MTQADIDIEERRSGWRTIKRVAPYLWPEGETALRMRVVLAMAALLLSKVVAVDRKSVV